MPEFKTREEYEAWKASKIAGNDKSSAEEKSAENISNSPSVASFFEKKKKMISIVIGILIMMVVFTYGFKSYQVKSAQDARAKAYEAYAKDAEDVLKLIGPVTAGLEVGYNFTEFAKKVADLNYSYVKFVEKYGANPDTNQLISYLAVKNSGDCLKQAVQHWQSKINASNDRNRDMYGSIIQSDFLASELSSKLAEKVLAKRSLQSEKDADSSQSLETIKKQHANAYIEELRRQRSQDQL